MLMKLKFAFSIYLPNVNSIGQHCLRWRYHMYGFHINTLQVFVEDQYRRRNVVWAKNIPFQDQTSNWLEGQVAVNIPNGSRVSAIVFFFVIVNTLYHVAHEICGEPSAEYSSGQPQCSAHEQRLREHCPRFPYRGILRALMLSHISFIFQSNARRPQGRRSN